MRPGHRRRAPVLALVVAGLVAVPACGGDGSGSASPSGGAGASVRILRLDVPKTAPCTKVTFTTVTVRYETRGAARAELRVNGRPIPLDDPTRGTVRADVRCDPLPHDFVLFAYDEDGEYTTRKKLLEVEQ